MKTERSMMNRNIFWAAGGMAALVAALALVFAFNNPANQELEIVHIEADYRTYSTPAELKKASDAVVAGSILDNGTTKSNASTPDIPRTEFSVKIERVFKGNVKPGDTVAIVLTGGTVGNRKYVFEDVDLPVRGSSMLMYLEAGDDGKYYPLAGGSALASKKENSGTFVFPEAVSGSARGKIEVTETEL